MKSAETSRALDIFRGFAAICMVMNHAGNGWLSRADEAFGLTGALVFLGSAAPALFFCATGLGIGLSRKSAPDWGGLVRKILLLVLADFFLRWSTRRWLGLDFFGFCAVSMVAATLVGAARKPRFAACAVIVACLLIRYGFVGVLHPLADRYAVVGFVSGVDGVEDVSYPLSPWLVFPMLGFIVGRASALEGESRRRPLDILAVAGAGLVSAAGGIGLALRGAVVHRWGSVSIAYFLIAVAIVAGSWLLAILVDRCPWKPVAAALSIRGPASLVVVPVHYALIAIAAAIVEPPYDAGAWILATAVLCSAVLVASKWIAICLHRLARTPAASRWMLPVLAPCAGLAAWAVVAWPPLALVLVTSFAEVVVAMNLSRSPAPVTRRDGVRTL